MTYSHNKRKKMRRRMRRFPHAFAGGEPTIPFVLESRWNLSKKSTREYLTSPRPFL